MIITISGYPGSGKSTVGKLLAKKLHYRYYSIGGMRRAMAKERDLTLQEFNVLGETKAFTDRTIDQWQKKLGRERDNLVVEGRTSFHFIPQSIKIFLTVHIHEAARRIFNDPSHVRRFEASHHYTSIKQLEHGLHGRIASDTRRYKKYYKLNIYLKKNYDLVINTTTLNPRNTLTKISQYLANHVRGAHGKNTQSPKSGRRKRKASNWAKVKQKKAIVDKMGTEVKFPHKLSSQKKKQTYTQ